jgi:hypothetical protein
MAIFVLDEQLATMANSNTSELPDYPRPPYKKRSVVACDNCRRLKMKVRTFWTSCLRGYPHISTCQCANTHMEPCKRCISKNIVCEYSKPSSSPINPTQPASFVHQSSALQAVAATSSDRQGSSSSNTMRTINIPNARSNVVRQRTISANCS